MEEGLSYDTESLYREITERAREQGVNSQEVWNDLVEQILNEHLNVGEFDPDDDLTELQEALQSKYSEFSAESSTLM